MCIFRNIYIYIYIHTYTFIHISKDELPDQAWGTTGERSGGAHRLSPTWPPRSSQDRLTERAEALERANIDSGSASRGPRSSQDRLWRRSESSDERSRSILERFWGLGRVDFGASAVILRPSESTRSTRARPSFRLGMGESK